MLLNIVNHRKYHYLHLILFLSIVNIVISDGHEEMVLVKAEDYTFHVEYRWVEGLTLDSLIQDYAGIRYSNTTEFKTPGYYIDKTEVTNAQFKEFMDDSGYKPKWSENFLKHWKNGTYPSGLGNHPVYWVSIEDAKAYATWAGKRLPTEEEWQLAAQSTDGRAWPWGNLYDPDKANMDSEETTPVGSYPEGASPYGALDMTGNVWEWTDSKQSDGFHYWCWIRGGSHYFAKGSRWYIQGGPVPNYQRLKFWLMTPALNRSPSIGFRCVKDVS